MQEVRGTIFKFVTIGEKKNTAAFLRSFRVANGNHMIASLFGASGTVFAACVIRNQLSSYEEKVNERKKPAGTSVSSFRRNRQIKNPTLSLASWTFE